MKKILLVFFSFLCSCSEVSENRFALKASLERQKVSILDLFDKLEVIPLETNDSCLLIWPDKVLCHDGYYEVFDEKHPALFVFDKDGRFVRKVGRKGDGPEEYVEIYDAIHDSRNGDICMLSPFGEIFVYSADGKFQRRLRLPQKMNYQAFEDFGDFFVTWTYPGDADPKGISLIDKESMLCVKDYWEGNHNLYGLYPRAFHKYKDELYFFRPFGREVYRIDKDSMSVAYQWDFGKDNYAVEDFGISKTESKGRQEDDLIMRYLKDSTIPYIVEKQAQTDKYYYVELIFGFIPYGDCHLFYRKSDGKSFFFKKTVEGIRLMPLFFNDEFMLCLANDADFEGYKKALNETEVAKLENRQEDDNPVLIKCYYK